jgi:hypothetical protein
MKRGDDNIKPEKSVKNILSIKKGLKYWEF